MHGDLVDSMAFDLHVLRIQGEDDDSYTCRTIHSALRYWMMAYALDDGAGGAYGISEDAILSKASCWLNEMLESLIPTAVPPSRKRIQKTCRAMLDDMIAAGDLMKISKSAKTIRCVEGHAVAFAPGTAALAGFSDPTVGQADSAFFSGTVMIVPSDDDPPRPARADRKKAMPVASRLEELDRLHSRLILNEGIGAMPMPYRCWLRTISWPDYGNGKGGTNRIVRRELARQCEWLLDGWLDS